MATKGERNIAKMGALKHSRLKKEANAEQRRFERIKKQRRPPKSGLNKKHAEILKGVKKQSAYFKIVPYRKGMRNDFYQTREWLVLRHTILSCSDGKCAICNTSKSAGAIMQVDHIKPRSKFPELELDPLNLQVLCVECNMGKGNKYIA